MTVRMLLLSVLLVGGAMVVCSSKVETTQDAVLYLRKYGYLPPKPSEDETYHVTEEDMKEAICHFQYMFNLDETCKLDEKTLAMMNVPRCGMPDVESHEIGLRKPKRYTTRSKWFKTSLTYTIRSFTYDVYRNDVINTMADAFKMWSDVSKLTFTRVDTWSRADISIGFYTGYHGDGSPFDGRSGVLAHAFFPPNGRVHFDDAETFSVRSWRGQDLLYLAVHEFGHSLGLDHSRAYGSVMTPYAPRYNPDLQLSRDDIAGIRALYGAKE